MKLKQVVDVLEAKIYNEQLYEAEHDVIYGFGCDLMSDALMLLRNKNVDIGSSGLLITGLITKQSIRTAEMLDIKVILFVRDKKPSQEIIDLASEHDIMIIGTAFTMYVASGILFASGLHGINGIYYEDGKIHREF